MENKQKQIHHYNSRRPFTKLIANDNKFLKLRSCLNYISQIFENYF